MVREINNFLHHPHSHLLHFSFSEIIGLPCADRVSPDTNVHTAVATYVYCVGVSSLSYNVHKLQSIYVLCFKTCCVLARCFELNYAGNLNKTFDFA